MIARRLRPDPTSGRRDDLRVAEQLLADSIGGGVEDLSVANTGPIQDVAFQIMTGSVGPPDLLRSPAHPEHRDDSSEPRTTHDHEGAPFRLRNHRGRLLLLVLHRHLA